MCQGKKLFQKIRRTFFGMAITRKYSTHNGNSNFDQDQETGGGLYLIMFTLFCFWRLQHQDDQDCRVWEWEGLNVTRVRLQRLLGPIYFYTSRQKQTRVALKRNFQNFIKTQNWVLTESIFDLVATYTIGSIPPQFPKFGRYVQAV